jgi:hypothetical protein
MSNNLVICLRTIPLRLDFSIKLKPSTMKKVFAIMAIAGLMVACNNSGEKAETVDSSALKAAADSAKNAMENISDSAKNAIENISDSAKKALDKVADTAKSKM